MTEQEAIIVAKIMLTADSWCSACQDRLLDQMKRAFPAHAETIDQVALTRSKLEAAYSSAREASDYMEEIDVWKV